MVASQNSNGRFVYAPRHYIDIILITNCEQSWQIYFVPKIWNWQLRLVLRHSSTFYAQKI
jgi:hypothetical protein